MKSTQQKGIMNEVRLGGTLWAVLCLEYTVVEHPIEVGTWTGKAVKRAEEVTNLMDGVVTVGYNSMNTSVRSATALLSGRMQCTSSS